MYLKKNDILFNDNTAEEIWNRDKKKEKLAFDNGFILITLWELDMKEMTDEEITNVILGSLK